MLSIKMYDNTGKVKRNNSTNVFETQVAAHFPLNYLKVVPLEKIRARTDVQGDFFVRQS